ncbi:MAG: ATP-binding protein [Bacteroidetes bacterium]|nr:ATP-binding protein [Bacteroidota bacterium]
MKKYFNVAGPCNDKKHYMIPVIDRNKEIISLIEQEHYFVIHAARQSGKTTLIQELTSHLEKEGKYHALYCSLEAASVFTDPEKGIPEILGILKSAVKYSPLPDKNNFAKDADYSEKASLITNVLKDYIQKLDKPFVIFFDEIDSLSDGTLIGFLRQLRDGYVTRSRIPFLHSAVLVGMRNIRDYKSKIREGRETLGSASPFNIITKALTIKNFNKEDIHNLYRQHTDSTGQKFEKQAVEKVYDQTDGQPWLVNAIAREAIIGILEEDYTKPVTEILIGQAIQNIILRRDTHIDSLLERLKEPRVQKIIEPIIVGSDKEINILDDDTRFCLDLGLIKDEDKTLKPANKIYNEVIIRTLSYNTQYYLHTSVKNIWIDKKGNIDMSGLLKGFQQFWRENGDIWIEKYDYKEAAPHLIMQAFLQRIINSGGSVSREYASSRERIDLCVHYGENNYPVELKLYYSPKTEAQGLEQLSGYMDTLGEKTGWLLIFDRRADKTWDEKIYWKTESKEGKTIHIVGC